MKREKIYEIPVNDAFDMDCECPLCILEKGLEKKNVEYCLGPAMMKPDFRIKTNNNGFCRRHLSHMLSITNKLPLALVLDTHLNTINDYLGKTTGFTKMPDIDFIIKKLEHLENSCVICKNISDVMSKYISVILYMWMNDEGFKEKMLNCKGFCLKHFKMFLVSSKEQLKKKDADLFNKILIEKEFKELNRVNQDINWFTKKFDHKNADADWKTSKDAPQRCAAKLWGYLE